MGISNAHKPRLSAVIPCHNEARGIPALLKRMRAAAEKSFGQEYELILIDDGSTDDTWSIIEEASADHSQTIGIKLSRNYGHQTALSAGLSYARGALIFVIDADLQDPPELLADMFDVLRKERADVVYGKRTTRKGESYFKKATASAFYRLIQRFSEVDIPTDTGDFRLMTDRVAHALSSMPENDRFIRGMVAWIGFTQVPFEYHRDERLAGETKYPLKKMLDLARRAFVSFSTLPLRFAGQFALLMFVLMFFSLAYTLFSWIFFDAVTGWTSLMALVSFSGGIQLLILSVLGDYIGRIYMDGKSRPLYIVDQVAGGEEANRTTAGAVPLIQDKLGIWPSQLNETRVK
ncbi:MAG: glycosyltransferase family 2 protein [Pseudomonadota bacterium]